MNKLFQQLQQTQVGQQDLQQAPLRSSPQLKNNSLLQNFLNSSNPKEFIQKMVSQNPKMQNVMQLFQSSNMTPKQFFYQYAQQNGINPDDFLKSFN